MLLSFFRFAQIYLPPSARAGDGPVRLYVAAPLVQNGPCTHILPLSPLKTQVRKEHLDVLRGADLVPGDTTGEGSKGAGQVWRMCLRRPGHAGTKRLVDRLQSEIGRRTTPSLTPEVVEVGAPDPVCAGNARQDHAMSRGRRSQSHAVVAANCGRGIVARQRGEPLDEGARARRAPIPTAPPR